MEKYPLLRERTQQVLDRIVGWTPQTTNKQRLLLEFSHESAIYGAAVAVACHKATERNSTASLVTDNTPNTSTYEFLPSVATGDKPPVIVSGQAMHSERKKTMPEDGSTSRKRPWTWLIYIFKKIFGITKAR